MQTTSKPQEEVGISSSDDDSDDLFKARLLAVLLEFGEKGMNLANIPKKWDQIWPTYPINSLFKDKKRKSGDLLKMIKARAGDVVRIKKVRCPQSSTEERKCNSRGDIFVIPRNVTRNDILKLAGECSTKSN